MPCSSQAQRKFLTASQNAAEESPNGCPVPKPVGMKRVMLDQVGGKPLEKDEWADAQYVLFKGLEDAAGGLDLERAFHKFVYKSLEFIGDSVFVLGFDDVDTDFSKGNEIMEVLRKYITTPQMIVLMTANYSLLYDMAVQKFWNSFKNNNFIEDKIRQKLQILRDKGIIQFVSHGHYRKL